MVWQRIDDQFGVSQKVIRIPRKRRQQVIGLWTLANNYAVRALTDGIIEEHELEELDAKDTDVAELVRVGLWHGSSHRCSACARPPAGGVVVHDFLDYNFSREQVMADREKERVRKAAQRQSRRSPTGTPDGTPGGSDPVSGDPVPSRPDPVPSPLTDTTHEPQSSPEGDGSPKGLDGGEVVSLRARAVGIKDLPEVLRLLRSHVGITVTEAGAIELVQETTKRARDEVKNVDAYFARACRKSPDEVRDDYDRLDIAAVS
ncbi:hypothetical protein [Frigoribacterium sp. VKM Ac-2530]|uniref:hypothetical protein n=1 Tax=Frigoribacterium sp. VKM Ac-2530 TaxID=2783822 RepID=UPI00188A2DD7|nr:hypothetical protein [Frigoribacterium sp. VKM Ac-2530]MBF4578922.1 hypothetical protein [Frigoribacterium sp. VKM Ac-2530]